MIELNINIETWDDFVFMTNSSINATEIRTPIEENRYNQTQIVFNKDGYVWACNNKGMIHLFKNCPLDLMAQIYSEKLKEQD